MATSTSASSDSSCTLDVDTRILVGHDRCTIRYRGPVVGTTGDWLGVEWDDPSRGKHNGDKDGVTYFQCRRPNSGSFIRPSSPKIVLARPFLATLRERYTAATAAEESTSDHESVLLGRSGIEVEAPNLAKVRKRLAKLRDLREIGIDNEGAGGLGEGEGEQMEEMGAWNTRALNFCASLVPSWEVIALVVQHLNKLDSLNLTSNRLARLSSPTYLASLKNITHLSMNDTLANWDEVLLIEPSLPNLTSLELSSNHLSSLRPPPPSPSPSPPPSYSLPFPNLTELRLDWNAFTSWDQLFPLARLTALKTLSLSQNMLPRLPIDIACLPPSLEVLHLAENRISNWESMDVLAEKTPKLVTLTVRGNGFVDATPRALVRLGLIARFGGLTVVEGSEVTTSERKDAELYYLSLNPAFPPDQIGRKRWDALVDQHGAPTPSRASRANAPILLDKLINITLHLPSSTPPLSMRVLPTMPLRTFKLKLQKTLKDVEGGGGVKAADMRLYGRDPDEGKGVVGVVEEWEGDRKTLGDLGVEEGGEVWAQWG